MSNDGPKTLLNALSRFGNKTGVTTFRVNYSYDQTHDSWLVGVKEGNIEKLLAAGSGNDTNTAALNCIQSLLSHLDGEGNDAVAKDLRRYYG